MHGSAVVSMCQKLPWGKTSLWGVWVYGNMYFCNKIKLHLWWNSSCPKVSAYTKLECRYLVCRYLKSKGMNPTLAICSLASSLLFFWHLHQKTLDLSGSLCIPTSSKPRWARPWKDSTAWVLAKSSPVTAAQDGSALLCAKPEMRRTDTRLTYLRPVTAAVTGGSCRLSPRLLICYHSFAFSRFQENSLTLFRKGRGEMTCIKLHGNSICAAFNIYLQHQNSWIYKLLSAAICKTLKRFHRGQEPFLRWGE